MATKNGRRGPGSKQKRSPSSSKLAKANKTHARALAGIKNAVAQIARHSAKLADHVATITTAAQVDPVGSCKYVDKQGQLQCESPVTQSYCMGIPGGHFRENGSCP
jgi:hypothetical protein